MPNYVLFHCSSKISTCLVIETSRKDTGGIIALAIISWPPHFLGLISGLESIYFFSKSKCHHNGTI